jgi:putative nucleotidyltransferase with HDIG domain
VNAGVWKARPWLAGGIRVLVVVGPAVVGFVVAWMLADALPSPDGVGETLGWLALLVAVTLVAVVITQRLARRLLPLSWLLTLTLAFPDRAPARLHVARRAASRRQRKAMMERARSGSLAASVADAPEAALVLVAALSAHDRRTRGHSERVRMLADVLAEELGIDVADRSRLRWGALLHDIGKLSVPGEILNKPGRPDESEWATLQRHPSEGKRLVEPLVTWLGPWAGAVGDHHEKWDGSGYPRGVAGEDISLGGRILSVADAYEVMTATRAYKKPASPAAARKELVAGAGTHFDPEVVRAFLGVSLGKLWWIAGASAALAQIPILGRLWTTPGAVRAKEAGSGPAVAVSALAVAVLTGVVSTGETTPLARTRPEAVAAPATPTTVATVEPAAQPVADPEPVPDTPTTRTAAPAAKSRPAPARATQPTTVTTAPAMTAGVPAVTAPGQPAPAPPAPPSGPAGRRELFSARGRALFPAIIPGLGLTELGFSLICFQPTLTGGIDGTVFELSAAARNEPSNLTLVGDGMVADVAFYTTTCRPLGRTETTTAGPELPVPAGARYVVVSPRSGGGEFGILIHARN